MQLLYKPGCQKLPNTGQQRQLTPDFPVKSIPNRKNQYAKVNARPMTAEEALVILDTLPKQTYLNDLQELVFCQSWEGRTYTEIAHLSGYDPEYIKFVGFRLWRLLSEKFGEKVTKGNIRSVLRRCSRPVPSALTQPRDDHR